MALPFANYIVCYFGATYIGGMISDLPLNSIRRSVESKPLYVHGVRMRIGAGIGGKIHIYYKVSSLCSVNMRGDQKIDKGKHSIVCKSC